MRKSHVQRLLLGKSKRKVILKKCPKMERCRNVVVVVAAVAVAVVPEGAKRPMHAQLLDRTNGIIAANAIFLSEASMMQISITKRKWWKMLS